MITGAHVVVYSTDAEADRAFLRDVLGFAHVDAGGGWLIFALPPSEMAVHPDATGGAQQVYLMTDDVAGLRAEMAGHGIACTEPVDEGWGVLMTLTLPSGAGLGVYQPRHPVPQG
ncbi:MAG: hypothetical protein QNJ16_07145 [Rhodobacter sp.]|nr:hypothetical protein [Rhodobacter sp.]